MKAKQWKAGLLAAAMLASMVLPAAAVEEPETPEQPNSQVSEPSSVVTFGKIAGGKRALYAQKLRGRRVFFKIELYFLIADVGGPA